MAAADDDDDLYGDLGGQENIYEISEELKRLRQENEQLRSRVQRVEAEKAELKTKLVNLAKNISSLFNTAKMEIQRKDREIQRLRDAKKKPAFEDASLH